jgi:hypothetical protein
MIAGARTNRAYCEGVGAVLVIAFIRWAIRKLKARREQNLETRRQAQHVERTR